MGLAKFSVKAEGPSGRWKRMREVPRGVAIRPAPALARRGVEDMARRGRCWSACVAVAVAAGSAAPSVAAPPLPTYSPTPFRPTWTGASASAFGESGPTSAGSTNSVAGINGSGAATSLDESPTGPAQRIAPPMASFPISPAGPADRPVGRRGAVQEYVRPAATGWIAVVGAVTRPGSYEIADDSVTVADLLARCGGLRDTASGTARVVRNGRAIGPAYDAADMLRQGDVLVVEEQGSRRYGVVAVSYEDDGPDDGSPVQLGIVGLVDRPVAVKVPGSYASVPRMLELANQTHLSSRDVTVLVGGSREVPGDQAGALTAGSVLVFDPRVVNTQAAAGLPTNYYPIESPPGELPSHAIMQAATELREASQDPFASLRTPPPPVDDDLSALPEVEMLDAPPDDLSIRYPRTADASGAVPIGPPMGDSHIVPVPADALYAESEPEPTSFAPQTAAPQPPTVAASAGLPAAIDEPSFENLAPTILVGGILGVITFVALRRLRGGRMFELLAERIGRRIGGAFESEEGFEQEFRTAAPADLLAALIADRLAFREEPVELPAALMVHGRSPALRRRRIDPPAAAVPQPHIPITAPATDKAAASTADRREANSRATFRVDAAQPVAMPAAARTTGTPFERALATLREKEGRRIPD